MTTIKGTINNDLLLAGLEFDGLEDVVLGLTGNDELDAGLGSGGNTLGGGAGKDLLFAGNRDLVLGDTEEDELDAGDEGGENNLYGGEGNDVIYTGRNDKAFGGAGDDTIYAGTSNNTLYGGTGRDRFWLVNAEVPTSVNIIADFDGSTDQIAIKLDGVNSLTDLSFEQTGADTVIKLAATGESLGTLKNVDANNLNTKNVVFSQNAPFAATPIRVATFNASLNRNNLGQLITDLSTPNHPQAKNIAEIIQRNNPDILLLNEFDYDANGDAIALFKSNYLGVSQNGVAPVDYPYIYLAPSNTGVDSGLDLDKNGVLGQGNDAFGFGTFPGQFGMVLLSKYPLVNDQVRTFQNFLWKDMPGNLLTNDPTANPLSGENGYYSPEAVEILRLSSKSHWDIPVNINGEIVHILAAHPTPPVFDGAEDRNGKRNYDEIRFWSDYVTPGKGNYALDDQGKVGGLKAGERFVILGDYNADPFDGDSYQGAINQFFNTPAIAGSTTDTNLVPDSNGAPEASQQQGGSNAQHQGNPSFDTADFADTTPGNLRVDYVLPSTNLKIENAGVFWPTKSDPLFGIVGEFNASLDANIYPSRTPSSDHRLVYNDLTIPTKVNTQARKTVTGVENLGLVTFSTGTFFKETQVGGLSGIVYDPTQNSYYAISDDRSSINPARFYTLQINLSDGRLDSGDVSFTQVTTLLDKEGNPFLVNSLDTEGIALTENGSVYISSEGEARPDIPRLTNPFVNEFSLSGQQLSELPVAEKYFPTQSGTTGIRNNLSFESLTITPDGRFLYTATENALAQDGSAATLENTSLSRIIKYDLTTGEVVAEYVYEVEKVDNNPIPDGSFVTNGLVELLAIDNNGTLLALERGFSNGVGNTVKLYQIQTQGALDVSSFDDLFWEAENTLFEIDSPVSKKLLVDFQADLGITPDNLEGLSLGPILPDGRQSLIVVSDNNFSATQTTQFIALGLEMATIPAVLPVVETPNTVDDAAGETTLLGDSDDPAVWIDPDNAEDSLIFGTLKDGGLAVFSLTGEVLQKITPADVLGAGAEFGDLRYNNVDVLYNFQLGTEVIDIALVSDRANDTLNIFKIDPTTHQLVNITSTQLLAPTFSIFGVDDGEATVYGLAGYRSPVNGNSYAFVTQASGNQIAQLELKADAQGLITAEVVRTIDLPIAEGQEASDYQSEAIAVDQEKGIVYVAVENEIGIVKFAAEPNGNDTISVVRPISSSEFIPDLEGLAIYYGPNGTGYLVASSQGDSSYAVYSRDGNNEYLGSFIVGDNLPAGIDQANETDGLDIINVPLGSSFPFGALLVQDGANDPQNAIENDEELENNNTNFKFVRWDDVANAFEIPLLVDSTSYNPRDSDINPQSLVNGVASGDVDQNSAILWTRSLFVGEVTFEYSKDANFSAIAGTKIVTITDPTLPVKAEVIGLTANTEYFYRVTDAAGATATGRFHTAALAGLTQGLTFGVSGDWRGELAPYPAISNVAEKNLDFFVEHGDTIYADYGSDAVLNADGSRKEQVETLAEYRAKHAEVYGSRLGKNYWADLRASTSVFAIIDDHEVINDFAGGAEVSTDERFAQTTGLINDTALYENGLTAFQEYNPLRDEFYAENTGDTRFDGERKLYRNTTFGKDASFFVIDTRSFRDQEINFVDANNDTIPDNPTAVIIDSLTTDRTLLGSVQLAELKQDLLASQASEQTWKFVMIPEPIQNILPGINVDAYEGYGKERAELLKFINDNKITNVVFVSADIHTTSVNNLTYQLVPGGEQIATSAFEITTGAVAFDQPLGEILGNFVASFDPNFAAAYNAVPIAPDTDSNPNDKDDLVKLAIKQQILQPGGFDPIGLNDNLAQAEGLIDATLLKGDYFVGHSYGWTEFDIDPLTQKLTVTTYGIDAYSEAEILAQAGNLDKFIPTIVSQFEVNPKLTELAVNNPPTAVILNNTVTQLAENSNTTGGIKVATISITDDGQGTNVLSLSGTDVTSFEIRNNELFFIGSSPDFETKTKYDVTVNADDITVGATPDASTAFTLNITNVPDQNITDTAPQFKSSNTANNLGSLTYDVSSVTGNVNTKADNTALAQTDALFHNLVGLYQVENNNGAILDTFDLNGNGAFNDLLNPRDFGYARTSISNAVNNFVLQLGANGDNTQNTNASEFGDVLLQGGKLYAPFAIANGGNLIPVGGTVQDGFGAFLAKNPNNTAASLSNFTTHAVAYFSFGTANPDGTEHLQNRGNNVFGFEDLPGNLGVSDFDFNDSVFKFTFLG